MKKFSVIALTFFCATALAQTVTVKKTNEKVKGDKLEGFSTELEGKYTDINSQWNKFLKDLGRVKLFSSDPTIITEPVFNGTAYPKGVLYAHIFENGSLTRVWIGIQPKEWEEKDADYANKQLEKIVYQFGIQFHRSKVQSQIDETKEAADAVERQKQRLANQNKDMNFQLLNNQQEKVHLEKAVDANKLEYEALLIKLERNKKAQDSLTNVSEQIKKVMGTHQEKLRKIN
jgi:hypothetical protein